MRVVRLLSFACVSLVVAACSSSSDGSSSGDSGSVYDGPYDDIVTVRPDDGVVDSGAPEISAETSTDGALDGAGDATSDASEVGDGDATSDGDGG